MADELGILLKILLDKRAQADIDARLDAIGKKSETIDKKSVEGQKKVVESQKKVASQSDKTAKSVLKLAKAEAEAAVKADMLDKKLEGIGKTADRLRTFGQKATILGAGITGGIFASAVREVNRQKESDMMTASTTKFVKAQERLDRAFQKFGQSAIKALIPLLEQAATLAEKVAVIIEKNPKIVESALAIGGIATAVGSLAMTVSQGLTVYKGLAQLASKILPMAGGGVVGSATGSGLASSAVGAGLSSALGTMLPVVVAAVVAYLAINTAWKLKLGEKAGNFVQRKLGMEETTQEEGLTAGKQAIAVSVAGWAMIFEKLGLASEGSQAKAFNATKSFLGLGDAAGDAADGTDALGDSAEELAVKAKNAADILADVAADQAASARKYADDVADINTNAKRSNADAARQYAATQKSINVSLGNTLSSIRNGLKNTLAGLATSFKSANSQADDEYKQSRIQLAEQSAEQVRKIHEDANKQLEELEKEHADTMAGFIDERDALAIRNEMESYEERKAAIADEASEAVSEVRKDARAQQAELRRNFETQRQLRAEEYARQVQEARAQASAQESEAIAQAAAARRQAADAFREQKAAIERQRQEALADTKKAFDREKRERLIAANEQLKELGYSLNAQLQLQKQAHAAMLAEASNFYRAQSAAQASAHGNVPTHASGGYTAEGLAYMHDKEFVATRSTTSALEKMLGGRLTQQGLLALAGGSGKNSSVTWNDSRRFYGGVSPEERNMIEESTSRSLLAAIGGAA